MKYKNYIFDLDGTLIDTEQAVLKTWQFTLKEYGYDFSINDVRVVLGVTTDIGLQKLNATVDSEFINQWQKNYEVFASDSDYFAGAKEMLLKLKSLKCQVGAVSSRSKNEYAMYFNSFDFDKIMDFVVLEEDTEKHKPDAEPLLKFIEMSKSNPTESIYIGDMPTDVLCAKNAGITAALVKWNGSNVDGSNADLVFNSMDEVIVLAN